MTEKLDIALLGVGRMGLHLGRHLAALGHRVRASNGKDPALARARLGDVAASVEATDTATAVKPAQVVFLAFMWGYKEAAIEAAGKDAFRGKIVVDLVNPYLPRERIPSSEDVSKRPGSADRSHVMEDLHGRPSSSVIAGLIPGARLVKAFNTINWEVLGAQAHAAKGDERYAIPVAGDDAEAKAFIMNLVHSMGFAPVDTGSIVDSRTRQEPGCPLYNTNLTGAQLKTALAQL